MYEQILDSLLTSDDLEILKYELGLLLNTNYKFGDEGLGEVLDGEIRYHISKIINEELARNNISASEYVKGILNLLDRYQIIELTLAFEPSRAVMLNILSWVKSNISEKAIIKYRYNPYLIGGAIVVSGGEYKNLSLLKCIDSYFDQEKDNLSGIISRSNQV